MYIAGYVQMKAGSEIVDDTNFYCENYDDFLRNLIRGGLTHPSDHRVQKVIFCFAFFMSLSGFIYKTFLINNFVLISQKYNFSTTQINTGKF